MKRFLKKKIPVYIFIIAIGLLGLVFYNLSNEFRHQNQTAAIPVDRSIASNHPVAETRLHDSQLSKPLLLTELRSESENLRELKRALYFEVNELKFNGIIDDASVFVRRMSDGSWTSVNSNLEFSPGSLMKIAAVIAYLKMTEINPVLLNKKFLFSKPVKGIPLQTFSDEPMKPGTKYSATEIMERVIVHSDNNATNILNEALDLELFKKLFTDLGFPEPDVQNRNYTIDAAGISKFMSILYNATYLNQQNSEYMLSLLAKSSFSSGIVSGIPAGIKVAHKFGEMAVQNEAQLHETAIVYIDSETYLITIMTKGKNVRRLPEALSGLSKIAYEKMKVAG